LIENTEQKNKQRMQVEVVTVLVQKNVSARYLFFFLTSSDLIPHAMTLVRHHNVEALGATVQCDIGWSPRPSQRCAIEIL
jgi:hypothetical protein